MDEAQFEALLAAAYRAPPEQAAPPDLIAAILTRAQQRRRTRRTALGLAALAGVGVAGAAIGATGLADLVAARLANLGPPPAMLDPSVCIVVGLVLTVLAVARNEIREF